MNAQGEILNILNQELERIRSRNPSYSLRAFARRLGVPVSGLSEAMNGRHRITRKMARRILEAIAIDPVRSESILSRLDNRVRSENRREAHQALEFTRLDMDQYFLVSDWYYFAILSLADTPDFVGEARWIGKRLRLPLPDARRALERLERLGLLARREDGSLGPTGKQFETSSRIANRNLRNSHLQNGELARRSMEVDPVEVCDFSSITMAIDPSFLPEASRRITQFRRELCAFLESGARKEVYKMNVQLFPLSRPETMVGRKSPSRAGSKERKSS